MSRKTSDKEEKTTSMRLLEAREIPYEVFTFSDAIHDAVSVAEITGHQPDQVYKTLVVLKEEFKTRPMLIMIAADSTLDLKKTAHALGVKKIRMAKHDEAEKLTGLQVGGISALALLNQGFDVYLDEKAILHDRILISAGKRGINLKLAVESLLTLTSAEWIDSVEEA